VTTEAAQLVGLVAATGIYGAAIAVTPAAVCSRIRRLPANWSAIPQIRDFYARRPALQPWRVRSAVGGWPLALVVSTAVVSGLFAVTGPSITVELGACVVGAGALTASGAASESSRSSRLASTLGLTDGVVDSALRPVYLTGTFAAWTGLLGIACFLGGSIGVLL
jgi:hypothetical protein